MSIAQKVLADPGKYSIQQLQQGMQSGVIPAYIAVPIIKEKVQQQKQSQMAQAMQQPPAQARPPVAEQVMTEARGLEALPTNLPTQMAEGGIVAFDEGGEVPRFNGLFGSLVPDLYEYDPRLGRAAATRAMAPQVIGPVMVPGAVTVGGELATLKAATDMARMTPDQRRGFYSNPMMGAMSPDSALAGSIMNAGQGPDQTGGGSSYGRQMGNIASYLGKTLVSAPGDEMSPKGYGITRLLSGSSDSKPAAATAAQPTDLGPVPGSKPNEVLGGASAGPAVPPVSGTGLGGTSALGRKPGEGLKPPEFVRPAGKSYTASAMEYYDEYGEKAAELDKKTDEAIKQANEAVKGKAFEGYKSALEKEALEAGAEKDQAKYMSLFKAGLAMMAGTSRHALENIGKGAMVGAEDYQAAVKDLKKAEKERRKEFAYIEQAQRAEALGDRDKAIDRLDKARDRADARLRYTGEGIYKGTQLDKQQAYDIAKTQFSSSSDIFRTHLAGQYQLGAAGISHDARMAALLASMNSRGQMNQKQVGDALLQLQQSPEALEYRKKLLKEKGERAANTQEFKDAMDQFVGGLFQKYYGGATRGGTGIGNSALNQLLSDPSVARYLNP